MTIRPHRPLVVAALALGMIVAPTAKADDRPATCVFNPLARPSWWPLLPWVKEVCIICDLDCWPYVCDDRSDECYPLEDYIIGVYQDTCAQLGAECIPPPEPCVDCIGHGAAAEARRP